MTTFSNSPRLVKGAIVGIDIFNPVSSVITFQYNPDTLTRTLQPQGMGERGGDRSEAIRLKGAPVETIKLDVEIDATDALETAESNAVSMGIYPQLSALEMLVYPKSLLVMGPMTFFIWGLKRILPVRLTELSITEEAHDVNLNPIRAKVSLGMRVLSYNDLSMLTPGYYLFLTHQVVKETMATIGSINNLRSLAGGNVKLV